MERVCVCVRERERDKLYDINYMTGTMIHDQAEAGNHHYVAHNVALSIM